MKSSKQITQLEGSSKENVVVFITIGCGSSSGVTLFSLGFSKRADIPIEMIKFKKENIG